jgi:hypothetical protein
VSKEYAAIPKHLPPEIVEALRNDPMTSIEDREQWHIRLGWLVCAWDVIFRTSPACAVGEE